MTTSIRIICDGNTEGDEVTIAKGWGKPENVGSTREVLLRGEVSDAMSVGPGDGQQLWLRIEGKHGSGRSLGPLEVIVDRQPDTFDSRSPGDA